MRVSNMTSRNGNKVANQFIITDGVGINKKTTFQSYDSVIATVQLINDKFMVVLDEEYWDYSRTTLKYLGEFLHEVIWSSYNTKKDIQDKIDKGEYILGHLN